MINSATALKLTLDEFDIKGIHLSKLSGVSATQISEFINGGRKLNTQNIDKIVQSLPSAARYYFLDLAYDAELSREEMKRHVPRPEPAIYSKLRIASASTT
jgi:plasmid maintenance system antidote protein VapI